MPISQIQKRSFAFSAILIKTFFLTAAAAFIPPTDGQAANTCKPLVFAEYCFEGPIKGLFPLAEMEKAFSEKAETLKAERLEPSDISDADRQWLEQHWRTATQSAYRYAKNHTLRLDSLSNTSSFPTQGKGSLNVLAGLLSQGPLFRLTFAEDEQDEFRLSEPVTFNRARLVSVLQETSRQFPPSTQAVLQTSLFFLNSLPGNNYVPVRTLMDHPVFANMLAMGLNKGRALTAQQKEFLSDRALGVFGTEALMVFYMQFDLRLVERNQKLEHKVHVYKAPGKSHGYSHTNSPQVTFNGDLLMPDHIFDNFSRDEIKLILQHEATHLAKPNFLTVMRVADASIRNRFPQIHPDKVSTYFSNVFGRSNPNIKDTNCPLHVPEDDELFTDYYVLAQYRNDPEKMDAYEALLAKMQRMQNAGAYSRLAFRLKSARLSRESLAAQKTRQYTEAQYNEAMSNAFQEFFYKSLTSGKSVDQLRLDGMLDEMQKYPTLQIDAKRMRVFLQYYKAHGHLKGEHDNTDQTLGLSCSALDKILRLPERG